MYVMEKKQQLVRCTGCYFVWPVLSLKKKCSIVREGLCVVCVCVCVHVF